MTKEERYQRSLDVRSAAANRIPLAAIPDQTPNQDEHDVPGLAGNFSKGLPHDADGLVQPAAYQKLVDAMSSGDPAAFEAIPLGVEGEPLSGKRPLTNPQAGLAYDLEGPDSHALALAPAPSLKSDEIAAEMAELYWMALLRDVPFGRYETNADAHAAAASLSAYGAAFKGPRDASGAVTPKTLFRGVFPGDEVGPYLSQFLLVGSGTLLSGGAVTKKVRHRGSTGQLG